MSRAGRPQNPLPDTPVGAVSAELRRQREQAGLTYRDLAAIAGYSIATVTAACGGRQLPSWKVTRACVTACGGDEDVIRGLYEQACIAEGRPVPEPPWAAADPPDPAVATTPAQFVACMASLRAWAGNPPLAELNRRSGGHLPPSTVSGVLRGKNLPRRDLVVQFASACGLPDPAVRKWKAAWENIKGTANPADGGDDQEDPPEEQQGTGPAPYPEPQPPPGHSATASFMSARVIAFLLAFLCALAAVPSWLSASLASSAAPGPVTVTLQVSGPADAQLEALVGAYLEALDLEGSGSISTTSLTLGGLPAGTAVGLLKGTGRSVDSCGTARWYIASSMPLPRGAALFSASRKI